MNEGARDRRITDDQLAASRLLFGLDPKYAKSGKREDCRIQEEVLSFVRQFRNVDACRMARALLTVAKRESPGRPGAWVKKAVRTGTAARRAHEELREVEEAREIQEWSPADNEDYRTWAALMSAGKFREAGEL